MDGSIDNIIHRLERSGFNVQFGFPRHRGLHNCKVTVDLIGRKAVVVVSEVRSVVQARLPRVYDHAYSSYYDIFFVFAKQLNHSYAQIYVNNMYGHFFAVDGDKCTIGTRVDGRNSGIRYSVR
jgi:hypothetical protein